MERAEVQSQRVHLPCEPSVEIIPRVERKPDYIPNQQAKQQKKKQANQILARGKSERLKRPAATQVSPYEPAAAQKKVRIRIPTGRGYDPFAAVKFLKVKKMDDWLRKQP